MRSTLCSQCGQLFPYQKKKTVCSPECYVLRRSEYRKKYPRKPILPKNKICRFCSKPFVDQFSGKKLYCSPPCIHSAHIDKLAKWRLANANKSTISRIKKEKKQVSGKKMQLQQLEFPV